MSDKLTSIMITTSLRYVENELLRKTGLTRTSFHRKALDSFIEGKHYIWDEFRITSRTNPNYVRRTYLERIYISKEREVALKQIAKQEKVSFSIVVFQALCDYCGENVNLLSNEVLENLERETYNV